jgi:hypothetical protein
VIEALEDQDIAVIYIPNAFGQTVIKDEEHRPLVDILVSIAPDVYGPYILTNKARGSGHKIVHFFCSKHHF